MFTPELAASIEDIEFLKGMADDGTITYSLDKAMIVRPFVNRTMKKIDALLDDVSIERVRGEAEIEFTATNKMPKGARNALGVAIYDYGAKRRTGKTNVDIFVDEKEVMRPFIRRRESLDALRYVYLHEIGHAFGLEHPFDNSDGDKLTGVTGDFTRMSYDYIETVVYNKIRDYTEADVDTISGIWNDTSRFSEVVAEKKVKNKKRPLCFTCGKRH